MMGYMLFWMSVSILATYLTSRILRNKSLSKSSRAILSIPFLSLLFLSLYIIYIYYKTGNFSLHNILDDIAIIVNSGYLVLVLGMVVSVTFVIVQYILYPDDISIPTKSNQEIQTEQHNFLIKHVILLFRIRLLVVVFVAFAIGYYLWHLFEIITYTANTNISAMLLLKQNLLTKPNASSDNIQAIIDNVNKLKGFYYLTEKEFIAIITLTIFAISGLAVLIKMFLSPMSLGTKQNDSENQTPDYARITDKTKNDTPSNDIISRVNSLVHNVTSTDNETSTDNK